MHSLSSVASEQDQSSDPTAPRRFKELDALRGLAALTVVLTHFYNMWMDVDPSTLSAHKRLALAIVRPFLTGTEAVMMFFILSGLVLSLPYLKGRSQPYPSFLLRRVLRIYGPYLVALALTLCADQIWHDHLYYGDWASHNWSMPLQPALVLQHVLLIGVFDTRQYLFVVWTLVQEMRISAIFPLMMLCAIRIFARSIVATACVVSVLAMGVIGTASEDSAAYNLIITFHFMAMFLVGIAIARSMGAIGRQWRLLPFVAKAGFALLSALSYFEGSRIPLALARAGPVWLSSRAVHVVMEDWFAAIGSAGFIIISMNSHIAQRLLKLGPAQWLGRISYSLYLVHPLVLLSLTYGLGNRVSKWVELPIYLAASLLLATAFCALVEERFIRWSRAVSVQ